MASLNKVQIIGNLGKDPEMRYMPNGDAVCSLTVATTETWKEKSTGEKKEATEWHRVVFFRGLAEIAGKYLQKGKQVYVEGKLKTRKWSDKDGNDRYTTEIVGDEMKMLGSSSGSSGSGSSGGESRKAPASSPASSPAPKKHPTFDDFDDDIPF